MKKTLLTLAMLGALTTPAFADTVQTNHGWVSLHTGPSTASSVAGRLQLGESAQLIKTYNKYWYQVDVNNRTLYITTNSNYTHVVKDTVQATAQTTTDVVQTNHGWVSLHTGPGLKSPIAGRLQLGQAAQLIKTYNKYWYEVNFNNRVLYITTNLNYTHVAKGNASQSTGIQTSSGQASGSGTVVQPPAQQTGGSQSAQTQLTLTQQQQKLMNVAKSQIGTPWKWGTQIPNVGFDCSNFTSWVYKTAMNIHFSSSSHTQRYDNSIGRPVPINPNNKLANLQVGDLLFFANSSDPNGGGHVGIYAGNGYIIQCGGGRGKVTYEKMAGTWFLPNLVYAKRIL